MTPSLRAIALAIAAFFVSTAVLPAAAAESTTGLLTGTVTTAGGAALAGATVAASSPSGRFSVTTDVRGRFVMLGVAPDDYVLTFEANGYDTVTLRDVRVDSGEERRQTVVLTKSSLATIGTVRAASGAFQIGSPSDAFFVTGAAAKAHSPTTSPDGLANYTSGTVQGAIANVPGVILDPFANAVLRGGRVSDAVFDFDSVPIPQGLIAEPGGNVDGAQLPTTGIGSTDVTLAGYSNEGDNALGGVVNQIAAVGTYPGHATLELADGVSGTRYQYADVELLGATPDLKLRYALASTIAGEYLSYGDGHSFYPSEAATYGVALQSRGQDSTEANIHYKVTSKDDISALVLFGQAEYDQYGSPYPGETVGAFDGDATTYPGETDPGAPVGFASGIRGDYDVLKAQWQHTGSRIYTRLQTYESRFAASAGGPFWDENGFPDGSISLFEHSVQREVGVNLDNDAVVGNDHLRFGAEYRINTSSLNQVVPTADETITSSPTVDSELAYLGDTVSIGQRLELAGTVRFTNAHFAPSTGSAYDDSALDPHVGASYRLGSTYALRANFDHITVAPAPLEADRQDSTNVDENGNPAPFVRLAPEVANDFTYSFEGGGPTQFRVTYFQKFEKNLIDVLPFNFRSAVSAGLNPDGIGVPSNAGDLRANGFEVFVKHGGLSFDANVDRAFSSSASQFAYNDLNAPAIAANHLFPVSYQPDFTAEVSYEVSDSKHRFRLTPSLSYESGYPYGNGKMVYEFDPATNKPVRVPNDNYVNPGANYYFLADPSMPYNAVTNPYIGSQGTNEGNDPNTLRSTPQILANLHLEGDLTPRLTAVLDVTNLLGNAAPTAYQNNAYLIGPPGYEGGNATYAACYGQVRAGTVPCAPGLPAGTTPYTLGNGVPTNDGVHQSVPWSYGTGGYIAQSYGQARTIQVRLKYRM